MKYRQLSPTGDYTFGQSLGGFYTDNQQAVIQAIQTRLKLNQGDWFVDITQGVPWNTEVLGKSSPNTRDIVIKSVILGTPGVTGIVPNTWSATFANRRLSITCSVTTIYSATPAPIALVI
jgi:hypothetical protein